MKVNLKRPRIIFLFISAATFLLIAINTYQGNGYKNELLAGDKAPMFILPDTQNHLVSLKRELKKGPVILSFYRGGWCPVCNLQLRAYQERIDEIKSFGAQLIAVSPEMPTKAQLTLVRNKLNFEVLHDHNNNLAKQYGIIWKVPNAKREDFSSWLENTTGKSLLDFNGYNSYELPIPATFVINEEGVIIYMFKDEDYTRRADIDDILEVLSEAN
jgi:peroxiredoxin